MARPNAFALLVIASITFAILLFSCGRGDSGPPSGDAAQIRDLLQKMYQWHETKNNGLGFDVIVKDTLQTGLDTTQLPGYIADLSSTNFFTGDLVEYYRTIVRRTDYKLKNDSIKYLNEINFGFQDADPWTFFQDTFNNYWDSLNIHHLEIHADSASLVWTIKDEPEQEGYLVKFRHEKDGWKVNYLKGFDTLCCW